ncbi:MAG: patatin-like phospholipase family protein [Pelistega sp.]|nr:patatin-like phospholipase family protein [Pelistega sp.]
MPIHANKPSDAPSLSTHANPTYGLFLAGGGARAAYQVGALTAIFNILNPQHDPYYKNPFAIVTGSSAGAINAAAYVSRADNPMQALKQMRELWLSIHTDSIYRSDLVGIFGNGLRWITLLLFGWMAPWIRSNTPRSLFDNSPLAELLEEVFDAQALQENLQNKVIESFGVSATSYSNGQHYTFFQSCHEIEDWAAWRRQGLAQTISVNHLLASSAIPFIFPANCLKIDDKTQWCGDGSMRQLAPLSANIRLGADKILVISSNSGKSTTKSTQSEQEDALNYPTLAQLGGHALSDIFIDGLSMDIERIERINYFLDYMPEQVQHRPGLKKITVLTLNPSKNIDEIALKHLQSLPRAVRAFLSVLGVSAKEHHQSGGLVASYLIFERSYTQELMSLGYADTWQRSQEIKDFFAKENYG